MKCFEGLALACKYIQITWCGFFSPLRSENRFVYNGMCWKRDAYMKFISSLMPFEYIICNE